MLQGSKENSLLVKPTPTDIVDNDDDVIECRCRHGVTPGSPPGPPQTSVTSPADYDYISEVDQLHMSHSRMTRQLDSVSDSDPPWPGHVVTNSPRDGCDSGWYPGMHLNGRYTSKPPEVGEKNWNESGNNMSDAGRQLYTHDEDSRSTFPSGFTPARQDHPVVSTVEELLPASPVTPLPPPPPLPAPVLTPVPSTNFRLAGGGTKTLHVTVYSV